MKKAIITVVLLLVAFVGQSHAALTWYWEYAQTQYFLTPTEAFEVEAIVYNDATSDEPLWIGSVIVPMDFTTEGFYEATSTNSPNVMIAPGESYRFQMTTYVPTPLLLEAWNNNTSIYGWGGGALTLIYNWVDDGQGRIMLETQKTSLNGYQVNLVSPNPAATIHVGLNEAYTTIQAGIDAANAGDLVIVRDGIYTGEGNKEIDFHGKAITVWSENGSENCIIDMEGSGRGFYFHDNESAESIVLGFSITNGNANYGGGIYCANASPTITNCIFTNNTAVYGGGIYCGDDSAPSISNCNFTGNSAVYGGGVRCGVSSAAITKSSISGNMAVDGASYWQFPSITNCTVAYNTAQYGGGISWDVYFPTITNCIIWGNGPDQVTGSPQNYDNISYSNVQGSYPGEGNINQDPLFVDPEAGNYHLQQGSPCIDAGTSDEAPVGDLESNARFDHLNTPNTGGGSMPYYDMGAHELVSEYCDQPPVIMDITFEGCISELCTTDIWVNASAPCEGGLSYSYEVVNGRGARIEGEGPTVVFNPRNRGLHPSPYEVKVTVTSLASGLSTSQIIGIQVKLAGDADSNGVVDYRDVLLVSKNFGKRSFIPPVDVNCDGHVNMVDMRKVLTQMGMRGCNCNYDGRL